MGQESTNPPDASTEISSRWPYKFTTIGKDEYLRFYNNSVHFREPATFNSPNKPCNFLPQGGLGVCPYEFTTVGQTEYLKFYNGFIDK